MKYSILGFSQEELVKHGLDVSDALLLNYIYDACASPKLKKIHDENEQPHVWLQHKKVLDDLPVLGFGEEMLKKRLHKLIEKGLISSIIKSEDTRGRKTYYTITDECENMRYTNQVENITLNQNDQVENITLDSTRPSVKNYPSDNKLIRDSKLDNTFTNVKVVQPTVTPEHSDNPKRKPLISSSVSNTVNSVSDSVNSNTSITSNKGVVSPIKKKNLYEKCMDEIEVYTDDTDIQELLKTYLPIRLARKDIVLNLPTFRGMLKTLNRVAVTKEDKIKSIQQSIDRQYPTFYEPHKRNNYNNFKKFAEGSKGLKSVQADIKEDLDEVL